MTLLLIIGLGLPLFSVASELLKMPSQLPEYSGTTLGALPNSRYELAAVNKWLPIQLLEDPNQLSGTMAAASLSFGYTKDVLWLYFELTQFPEQPLFLQLGATFLDRVELFYRDASGQLQQQITGDHIPFFERPVLGRSLVLRLPSVLEPSVQQYILKVETGSTLTLRPVLLAPPDLLLQEKNTTLAYGILFGLSLMATLLAGFSWVTTKQYAYFIAACYSLTFAWFHFTINGFDQQYLYPQQTAIADQLIGVSGFLLGALLMLLVQYFVPLRQLLPRLSRLLDLWVILYFIGALASALGAYPKLAPVLMLAGLCQTLILLGIMLWAARHVKPVPSLLVGMVAPGCLAIILQSLRNLGYLPYNFWTSHLWAFTAILQVSFLMLVLLISLNRQQRELQQQLEHNVALQRFYQLIAHELRTPLAVVSSALTNLSLQVQSVPAALPRIERARLATARLSNLIDNALAEDRLHLLDEGLELTEQSLFRWLDELSQLCLLTERHDLEILKPEKDYLVKIDQNWLTLAVLNLLDNAVKYSANGGTITLSARFSEASWVIRVEDQGDGIDEADIPMLFNRGFRSRKHKHLGGLGLGLYLVNLVVESHQGETKVTTSKSGTQIEIILPRRLV
ncbi:sensor histidine kinase [Alishewanella sp. BS5-314]|uniref:sensor histidine kinase n=1 Tax=Alishewanella sp. BS5-314 TaxID=2755587 RepID=UPI0021BA94AF|nr:sensor histidine kinase [Alishewanella sp. BS5-314]MCT8124580.1 sensor histidine kinase [Alishewanella sp. BS5-314]